MPGAQVLRMTLAAAIVGAAAAITASPSAAAPPTLTRLYPAGAQRGTESAITCTGEFGWPVNVWAPGLDVRCSDESGKLLVGVPAGLATDRTWIRLYNNEGASAQLPLVIGGLPELVEHEPNNSPQEAQVLESNRTTLNGVLEKNRDVDSFAVQLQAGETLVAAVAAHESLGSPMDAIIQIVSPQGFVLAENNDHVGLDPLVVFTANETGTYVVRIFAFSSTPDTRIELRGGAEYVYRLTMTTGPYVTHALPLTVSRADPGSVELHGWNLSSGTRAPVVPLGGAPFDDYRELEMAGDARDVFDSQIGFAFLPDMAGGARVRIVPFETLSDIATPTAEQPHLLTPPVAVSGCIRGPEQTDTYRLNLVSGQVIVAAVESHSLNLPLHPVLHIRNASGDEVASAEPRQPSDAVASYTADKDGEYVITVSDLYDTGHERNYYRLTVRAEVSDFQLVANADQVTVKPDAMAELTINVQRRKGAEEAVGPITISAVDLPAGVTAEPVVSESSGESAEKVTLKFSTSGAAFAGPIRIVGRASSPRETERYARTPARLGVGFERLWLTAVKAP